MEFIELQVGPFVALAWRPWVDAGFSHGFIGKTGHFRDRCLDADISTLAESLGASTIRTLTQVHGDYLVWSDSRGLGEQSCEGDGWLRRSQSSVAMAVLTADCMPVTIRADSGAALVHVGWRGLVCGIASKACDELYEIGATKFEVVVGPAASVEHYEVGPDVIQAIGPHAVVRKRNGQTFLSLVGTLEQQLLSWATARAVSLSVNFSSECTIGGGRYHSHRRDGPLRGSNIAWML